MYSIIDIEELVDNLNTTLWRLDKEFKVFDGKCCLISYCIAKQLEDRGISFNVIFYTHPNVQSKDIFKILREEDMSHVTIEIATGNKKFIIGENLIKDDGLNKIVKHYTSDELLDMYKNYNWNNVPEITDDEIEFEIDMTFDMM